MLKLVIYQNYQIVKDSIPIAGAQRHGALICLALMLSRPAGSWWRLGLRLVLGLAVYFVYAWRVGRLGTAEAE